jgi:Transposase DDE domain
VASQTKAGAVRRGRKKQAAAARHKKATSPQLWLTLVWHVGSGLPWAWRTGPSGASERDHLVAMVPELPAHALLVADAGFVGYELWQALLTAGHHFVIRVGANVRLLRQLGWAREHAQVVYLWPDQAARKRQPPLVLRLVVVQDGKQPVYLVTDLSKSRLSDRQVATIYGARWGVEVFFRTFKQTFGCRKLRSRSARNAQLELEWSLMGLWGVCLLGTRELSACGYAPTRLSPAAALYAFQRTLREYRVRPETSAETLWAQLRLARLDAYQRRTAKTSRAYPRKKHRTPIGIPHITLATDQQIAQAAALQNKEEYRLAA